MQKACFRDLFKEWETKKNDDDWFNNGHYASYCVLNLCRILYTVMSKRAGSKKTAGAWVKRRYGEEWTGLVVAAVGRDVARLTACGGFWKKPIRHLAGLPIGENAYWSPGVVAVQYLRGLI